MKVQKDKKKKHFNCNYSHFQIRVKEVQEETWLLKSTIQSRPLVNHIAHKDLTSWAWNQKEKRCSKLPSECFSPFTKLLFLVLHLLCFQNNSPWRTPCHNLTTMILMRRLTKCPTQVWPSAPAKNNLMEALQPSSELVMNWTKISRRKWISHKLIYSMTL